MLFNVHNFIQRYIYGGIAVLEKHDASFIFELMLIAYQFLLDELAKQLQTHLIEKEAHWLRLHFNRIYQESFQNNKLEDSQNWCNDFVVSTRIRFLILKNSSRFKKTL